MWLIEEGELEIMRVVFFGFLGFLCLVGFLVFRIWFGFILAVAPFFGIFCWCKEWLVTERIKWYGSGYLFEILEMSLVKEYVITEISAAPDGSPFILVTLKDPSDIRGPQMKVNNPSVVNFTSINDLM